MMEWWSAREPREKLLLQVAGGLLVAVVLLQFILLPLVRQRADLQTENFAAMQTLDVVSSSTPSSATAGSAALLNDTTSIAELRSIALALATERGLAISRIQGSGDDEVIMIMDSADPQLLFAWLADIQLQQGARPSNIALTGDASGGVRASISFSGGAN